MIRSFLREQFGPVDSWRSFMRSLEIVVIVVAAAVLLAGLFYLAADIAGLLGD